MEPEFIKWLVGQVGLAGVAGLALLMLRQSYEERLKELAHYQEDIDRLHVDVRQAVKDNTEAFIDLIKIMQDLRIGIERNEH